MRTAESVSNNKVPIASTSVPNGQYLDGVQAQPLLVDDVASHFDISSNYASGSMLPFCQGTRRKDWHAGLFTPTACYLRTPYSVAV